MEVRAQLCSTWTLMNLLTICGGNVTWEIPRFDGWFNSLTNPRRGSAGSRHLRLVPAQYQDGVYQAVSEPNLPNPRQLSRILTSGPSGLPSKQNQTVLSVFFGYHVVFETSNSRSPGCPPEFLNIRVPKGDSVFDPGSRGKVLLPFQRGPWDRESGQSPSNPRTPINSVTSWIDGSSIYGPSASWSDSLRSFSGGGLSAGSEWNLPRRSSGHGQMWSAADPSTGEHGAQDLFEFGNLWANENVFTAVEAIVWFRYHNYVASDLVERHPHWSDEQLFHNTRKIVVATLQNVALYEWLPSFIHTSLPSYPGHQRFVDPGISVEFEAAAIRLGITLAPPGVYSRNRTCHYGSSSPARRLCNSFWKRQSLTSQDVDELLMGMTSQIAERTDNVVVEDLRDFMYGPLRFSRSDLVAVTLQRGRDFGLQSYCEVREALDLPAVGSFEEINLELNSTNPQLIQKISDLYDGDVRKLELFAGGLLESQDGPGPVFSAIILEQFQRIRNGDRFWFENRKNGLFTDQEIQRIRDVKFHDVLVAVTRAEASDLQKEVFFWKEGDPCPQPAQLRSAELHSCTNATRLNYFDGSNAGFGLFISFLLLLPLVSLIVASLEARRRKQGFESQTRRVDDRAQMPVSGLTASEWQGHKQPLRSVSVEVDERRRLQIWDRSSPGLRRLSLRDQDHVDIRLSSDRHQRVFLLKVPKEYDLVLFFDDENKRALFLQCLRLEVIDRRQQVRVKEMTEKDLLQEALTREQRAEIVETFTRQAFSKVLEIDRCEAGGSSSVQKTREVLQCELTALEFADVLGLKSDSLFVESMFALADKDGNGYLSFQEFLDVMVIFMKGSPEEKSQLMFSMNDIDGTGFLSKEEFARMLRSFMEISNGALSARQADDAIAAMMQALDFNEKISWQDFHFLLRDHEQELQFLQLNVKGMEKHGGKRFSRDQRVSFICPSNGSDMIDSRSRRDLRRRRKGTSPDVYVKPERQPLVRHPLQQKVQQLQRLLENYRRHILCLVLVYGVTAGVALERCYYYGVQAGASGLPGTTAVGIVVSRSSAAAASFLFPFLLLTVCRNLITLCRQTFLNKFIPFDAALDLHRLMAMSAGVFSVLHSLGHVVNIYIFSVSDLSILSCLFPHVFFNNGSELPQTWTWWFFQTVPGVTGVLLLLTLAFIYVFASHYFRRISFRAFWISHQLYGALYVLTVLHGSFALLQEPTFYIFLVPPALLFLLDKLISLSRTKLEIPVVRAELLPSGVTHLELQRPRGFVYRSGQWVRVACEMLGADEFHPFTLTSAPHEETLSLHIRAVGPWTSRLRELFTEERLLELQDYPKIHLDGPFGDGHQEWSDYEVCVLVGAGIGVTPFASILKDLVFKSSIRSKIQCKKVYFLWVTRTQRQFEWVSDIIREVEATDALALVSVHTYITQVAQKFDLRTTMLYVCERHFQKLWKRSLFTGLRSVTHFGRPPFAAFFRSLQEVHPEVRRIGVFSCGPPGLSKNVEEACGQMNRRDQNFIHHFQNF